MSLFHHTITFPAVDPLGDGLAEEIAAEQQEPEAMSLDTDIDGNNLSAYWQYVTTSDTKESKKFQNVDE